MQRGPSPGATGRLRLLAPRAVEVGDAAAASYRAAGPCSQHKCCSAWLDLNLSRGALCQPMFPVQWPAHLPGASSAATVGWRAGAVRAAASGWRPGTGNCQVTVLVCWFQ